MASSRPARPISQPGSPPSALLERLIVAAVAGTLLTSFQAEAQVQETPPSDALRFDTRVLVTPERGETPRLLVPASTVALEARSLPLLPIARTSELVSFLPGFQVLQTQPYASGPPLASARGFFGGGEAEYILLLVDGVPIADAESGLIDWSLVPTASVRRIEAFRGPGASLYGDAAIGGVIQVLTDRSDSGGQATASGGSFGTVVGDASYGRRGSPVNFLISGSALRSAGAWAHGARKEFVATGGADGRVGDVLWRWTASGNDRDREDPGVRRADQLATDAFGSEALFRFDRVDRNVFNTAFTLARAGTGWQHHARVHATTRNEDLVRTILLAPGLGDRRARDLSTVAVGGSVETDRTFSVARRQTTLRFGLDLSREHADTGYRSVSGSGVTGPVAGSNVGRRLRAGAFVLTNWDVAPRVRVSGSVRWDRIADDFSGLSTDASHEAWSPRVGATVLLDRERSISLFSQVSRAFKAPTVNQLFDPRPYPDFRGGTFTISNAALEPQRVTNAEAGVSGGTRLRWSALAYRMEARHEIDFDIRTFSYANIGESRHTGFEIEGAGTFWTRVQPSVAYAFSRVTETARDEQLKNIPRHAVSASVNVDLPWATSVFARYRRTAGAFLDDENRFSIDGPSTVDLRVRRRVGQHTIFFDALNVTDNRSQEYGYTLADLQGRVVQYLVSRAPARPEGRADGLLLRQPGITVPAPGHTRRQLGNTPAKPHGARSMAVRPGAVRALPFGLDTPAARFMIARDAARLRRSRDGSDAGLSVHFRRPLKQAAQVFPAGSHGPYGSGRCFS